VEEMKTEECINKIIEDLDYLKKRFKV